MPKVNPAKQWKIPLIRFGELNGFVRHLRPSQSGLQPVFWLGIQPTQIFQSLNEGWISFVSKSSSYKGLSFGDIVELLEGYRVTIRISYKIIAIKNEVGFGNTHEIFT